MSNFLFLAQVQFLIGILIFFASRFSVPKDLRKIHPHTDGFELFSWEEAQLKGITKETPNGVDRGGQHHRLRYLRYGSLGEGFGIGLLLSSVVLFAIYIENSK